jgi:hypothetical protein
MALLRGGFTHRCGTSQRDIMCCPTRVGGRALSTLFRCCEVPSTPTRPWDYYKAFSGATGEQRQTFENYALAKVIWCIFEEETNQVSCFSINDANAHMLRDDGRELHETVFAKFLKTPPRMRYWICACTRSSKEWLSGALLLSTPSSATPLCCLQVN